MNSKREIRILFWIIMFIGIVFLTGTGCQTLKVSKPIIPLREYEKMLVGRLDAQYVGNETCLAACHYHDQLKIDFEASTMGAQLSTQSGLPVVDCESCHGPGSIAIRGVTAEKVAKDKAEGKITACNHDSLLHLDSLPATAQSLLCLKCHSANATFNLHNWRVGSHATADVSCFSCHDIHAGSDLMTNPQEIDSMCEKCHQRIKVDFLLPSHHPVPEKRVFCVDCHEPHGTITDKQLRENSVKETCTRCHGEKEGPFVYEHADSTEDCMVCHTPHGSVNNMLLKVRQPYLCMQCHAGHRTDSADISKPVFFSRCTNCHTQIHGSDLPSVRNGADYPGGAFTH